MKKLHLVRNYLAYRFRSVNEHGVHSPFVFELLLGVVYNRKKYYAYKDLEKLRSDLLLSAEMVNCNDLGAGSLTLRSNPKTVRDIARSAAKPPKYAELLFRLVNHFQPSFILELGTSIGISAAYMASANSKSMLITVEGCDEVAEIAKKNFRKLGLNNIEQLKGNFDQLLPEILKKTDRLDFVFFDGNHRKEPTLNYFKQCLEKAVETSIFLFDDIYWSAEMTEAWEEIKQNEKVTVSLDLFYMGIVFFRKEQVKQHFTIKY
ncbi:MAG TPA: class I SAM-dependent methyltransferase [Bacteroidia bacterium]